METGGNRGNNVTLMCFHSNNTLWAFCCHASWYLKSSLLHTIFNRLLNTQTSWTSPFRLRVFNCIYSFSPHSNISYFMFMTSKCSILIILSSIPLHVNFHFTCIQHGRKHHSLQHSDKHIGILKLYQSAQLSAKSQINLQLIKYPNINLSEINYLLSFHPYFNIEEI